MLTSRAAGAHGREAVMSGSANMVRQLEEMLAAGQHYEAQQMYQNAALRLASHEQHAQARVLLRDGVGAMIGAGRLENATQLARQYVEICAQSPPDDAGDGAEGVARLVAAFPAEGAEQEQLTVLHAGIKWTAAGKAQGDARLHLAAARCHRALGEHGAAAKHYARGFAPAEFAAFVAERCRASGKPGEEDLFACRATLQLLALGNAPHAHAMLAAFAQQFEPQGLPPTPLLNFSRLFIAAVEREDYVLYTMLLDEYRPALSRDPSFLQFAGHIGEVWFGVPHKKGGGGLMGMLSDFMS